MTEVAGNRASSHVRPSRPPDVLLSDVEQYYSGKLRRFGPCALGVDWACDLTQQLRFVHLLKVCDSPGPFSVNDFGCGYGAIVPFLAKRFPKRVAAVHGVDLSPEMISAARVLHKAQKWADFEVGHELSHRADYSIASGVFNVKLGHSVRDWEQYVRQTLSQLSRMSGRGFAVNFLLPLTDAPSVPELYCTGSQPWAEHCRQALGCEVEVLANYGLQEFTLIARRSATGPPN